MESKLDYEILKDNGAAKFVNQPLKTGLISLLTAYGVNQSQSNLHIHMISYQFKHKITVSSNVIHVMALPAAFTQY